MNNKRKVLKCIILIECIILVCIGIYWCKSNHTEIADVKKDIGLEPIETVFTETINDINIDFGKNYFPLLNYKSSLIDILPKNDLDIITKDESISIEEVEQVYKTNEEIANEVVKGLWGNGEERRERITEAGYDYESIQEIVDKIVYKSTISNKNSSNNNYSNSTSNSISVTGSCIGTFWVTGYHAGEGHVGQVSATGMPLVPWGTCAMNRFQIKDLGLSYGDYITVSGVGTLRIVDNGCSYGTVDVYVNNNSEAYSLTGYKNVYR